MGAIKIEIVIIGTEPHRRAHQVMQLVLHVGFGRTPCLLCGNVIVHEIPTVAEVRALHIVPMVRNSLRHG